ncbi:unnamed protein product [Rhizoctonia solani]|uniref:O-methylsterigmatocystin oxidoreductase n=1 Tax=Rhizoctonia solani TaxID=456999 RepID=A0A8H2WBR1_9AGAM|nr:unnamed protein product [Rhizoctonia solani]
MSDTDILFGLTAAAGLLVYKLYKDSRTHELSLPSSPKSYPLIGNLLSLPSGHEHLGFMKLGEELENKIISLNVFGTTIVILNDRKDAENLLDKRSRVYSDRSCPPLVQEPSLLGWGDFASLVGYGDRWRKYRRLMNPWLTKKAIIAHHKHQEHATRKLLQRLLGRHQNVMSSHGLEAELYLSVSETLLHSIYGYEAATSDDRFLVEAREVLGFLAKSALSSNYLVNVLPILKYVPEWFPGAGWKRDAIKWRKRKEALIKDIYNIGLKNMNKNKSVDIIAGSMRAQALKIGLTKEEADDYVEQITITMFAGGTDTTVNTLLMFFTAMLLYPNIWKKAQNEIDSVLGQSRLPKMEDQAQLGYIDRIVQETLRWAPVTPIAFPHTCFQDDVYEGYRIPKGAIVIGNVWAMTRDETVYGNPEIFDPDRYLDPATPPSPVFGWGRRRCPGLHFAQASLFVAIASILMVFDLEAVKDENGQDILPSGGMIKAAVLSPELFEFKLTPRSAKHEELIRDIL